MPRYSPLRMPGRERAHRKRHMRDLHRRRAEVVRRAEERLESSRRRRSSRRAHQPHPSQRHRRRSAQSRRPESFAPAISVIRVLAEREREPLRRHRAGAIRNARTVDLDCDDAGRGERDRRIAGIRWHPEIAIPGAGSRPAAAQVCRTPRPVRQFPGCGDGSHARVAAGVQREGQRVQRIDIR